jgi:short-subunit dehydrogenase involved in D-alanine esterification of teichoic acids
MNINTAMENSVNGISTSNTSLSSDETKTQLQEYLIKLIELVPNLKQQHQMNLNAANRDETAASSSYTCLEQLSNLDLNTKEISDLQILQSVLDYIGDLKAEIVCSDQSP